MMFLSHPQAHRTASKSGFCYNQGSNYVYRMASTHDRLQMQRVSGYRGWCGRSYSGRPWYVRPFSPQDAVLALGA